MEKLTKRQQAVIEVLDEQIAELEDKLQKAQPLINELNRLKATRRTLLSEKRTTGGSGNGRVQLSMEEVIRDLTDNGASEPGDIAQRLGVDITVVRSHLNRHKGSRYGKTNEGWDLTENIEEE